MTNPDTITITPEIWRLRALAPRKDGRRYGIEGVHLDGEYAVATDGSALTATRTDQKIGPTMRLDFISPHAIYEPIEIPSTPGIHAVPINKGGRVAVVEVWDCGATFVDWRSVIPKKEATPITTLSWGLMEKALRAAGRKVGRKHGAAEDGIDIYKPTSALAGVRVYDDSRQGQIIVVMPIRREV